MRISGSDAAPAGRVPVRTRLVPPGAGDTVHVLVDSATVKVGTDDTAGTLSLIEVTLAPGGGVPDHAHDGDDETLYVLDGALDVRVGDERLVLGVGSCAFAPRGVVHGYANRGFAPARLLVIASPAQDTSRMFVELAANFAAGGIGGQPTSAHADAGALAVAFRRLAAARGVQLQEPGADPASER